MNQPNRKASNDGKEQVDCDNVMLDKIPDTSTVNPIAGDDSSTAQASHPALHPKEIFAAEHDVQPVFDAMLEALRFTLPIIEDHVNFSHNRHETRAARLMRKAIAAAERFRRKGGIGRA